MDGFWQSLPPFFKKFGLETIFIFVALIVLLFSFFGFLNEQNNQSKASDFSFEKPQGKQSPISNRSQYLGSAIIDANDIGRNVLGNTISLSNKLIEEIFKDNPMGQTNEQTPITIVIKL